MVEESTPLVADRQAKDQIEVLDAPLNSPALDRLLEEIRVDEELQMSRSYNRTYNRHNR